MTKTRSRSSSQRLKSADHPVTSYARAVVAGDVPTGKLVRQACERHLRDLESSRFHFDEARANRALAFFRMLRHSKGRFAGEPFVLSDWQTFIVGSLFGWVWAKGPKAGRRRFNRAYLAVPRKNGKSTLVAGLGLYLLSADGEAGSEVYAAATKRDQAKIVWSEARRMVLASGALRRHINPLKTALLMDRNGSSFVPLGADADTLDGLNPHGVILDELHAHKSRDMWDVMTTALGARTQPLLVSITTAGRGRTSVCREQHDHCAAVLAGSVSDDAYFAFIAQIDDGDDWTDEAVWHKANPNLGVSIELADLRTEAERAKQSAAQQNAFRRLHLNEWTEQTTRWLDIGEWESCGGDLPDLTNRACYGGLDLSRKNDITAFALIFPPTPADPYWHLKVKMWCPAEAIERRSSKDRVPYDGWARGGWITPTDGNMVDYRLVRRDIEEIAKVYKVREIGYDPWNALETALELQDAGFNVVEVRQGARSLSEPMKKLEGLIGGSLLAHEGSPVMRWMAGNVAVKMDPNENIQPDKSKSGDRIDGIVAAIIAMSRAISGEKPADFSHYVTGDFFA